MKKHLAFFLLVGLLMAAFSYSGYAQPPSGVVISKNSSKTKKVALTFDDGPHPRYTREILKILEEYEVTATFFVIGVNIQRYPDAFAELVASGCEIGNHTYSHNSIRYAERDKIEHEIMDCQNEIVGRAGRTPSLFRPPEGRFNQCLEEAVACMNYRVILWSIDTMDWAHTPPDTILQNVLRQLDHGDIILMHDYISGQNTTCDALRMLIPAIKSRGYEFVTVSELISGDAP